MAAPETQHERDPERPGDDRRMAGRAHRPRARCRRPARAGGSPRPMGRGRGDEDGRTAVARARARRPTRPGSAAATRRPTSRTSAARSRKYSSSTAARRVRLLIGRSQDRLVGGGPGVDQRQRRVDDPRVAREQGLRLEDRADLLARPLRPAGRRAPRARAAAVSRAASQPVALPSARRADARATRCRRGPSAAATSNSRPMPTPGDPARPTSGRASRVMRRRCRVRQAPRRSSARARSSSADEVAPGSW